MLFFKGFHSSFKGRGLVDTVEVSLSVQVIT